MTTLQQSDPSRARFYRTLGVTAPGGLRTLRRNIQQLRRLPDQALWSFIGIALTIEHSAGKISGAMRQNQPLHRRMHFGRFKYFNAFAVRECLAKDQQIEHSIMHLLQHFAPFVCRLRYKPRRA